MKYTVGICTRDRLPSLMRALRSLEAMEIPGGVEVDVLIVANGCRDGTANAIRETKLGLQTRVVVEDEPGLARARNRLIANADCDFVLWLDDDAEASPHLLTRYHHATLQFPMENCFAGAMLAAFDATPPRWVADMQRLLPSTLSHIDLGPFSRPMNPAKGELPFGGNMMIRHRCLVMDAFCEAFGRGGAAGCGGEETEWFLRTGHACVWVAGASVTHWISESRLTLKHVRRYWRDVGKQHVRLHPKDANASLSARIKTLRRNIAFRLARLGGVNERYFKLLQKAKFTEGMYLASREGACG